MSYEGKKIPPLRRDSICFKCSNYLGHRECAHGVDLSSIWVMFSCIEFSGK